MLAIRRGTGRGRRRSGSASIRLRPADPVHPAPFRSRISHQLVSSAPTGIASRTSVPPSGRECTPKRAPISSARSRMNCRPKFRRPGQRPRRHRTPRPSSRTERPSRCRRRARSTVTAEAAPCFRTFCSASQHAQDHRLAGSGSAGRPAASSLLIARPVSAVTRRSRRRSRHQPELVEDRRTELAG